MVDSMFMGMEIKGKMICPWRHETEVTLFVRFETRGSMRWRLIDPSSCPECGADFKIG